MGRVSPTHPFVPPLEHLSEAATTDFVRDFQASITGIAAVLEGLHLHQIILDALDHLRDPGSLLKVDVLEHGVLLRVRLLFLRLCSITVRCWA
jgi:hypothetical protein